jgi:thiol:disulfide interchange protein
MDRDTFAHPELLLEAHRFVAFKLDVTSAEGDAELSAGRHGVEGVPTTIVFDARGEEAARRAGPLGPAALLEMIRKAGER